MGIASNRVFRRILPLMMCTAPSLIARALKTRFQNGRMRSTLSDKLLVMKAGRALKYGGPFLAQLNVTNECNQRCAMCNLWHDGKRMPLSDAIKAIDACDEMGTILLTITGGEPVLHPDLSDILNHAADKHILLNINTNGTLPLKRYEVLPLHHLDIATISFHTLRDDVLKRITRTDSLVANITKVAGHFRLNTDAHIVLKFVISSDNIGEIDDVQNFADDLGVSAEFDPVMTGSTERPVATSQSSLVPDTKMMVEALSRIKEQKMRRGKSLVTASYYDFCIDALKRGGMNWPCDAGLTYFSIQPDGRFGICKDIYTDLKITDDGFAERWRSNKFRDLIITLKNTCEGCTWSCYHTASAFTNPLVSRNHGAESVIGSI